MHIRFAIRQLGYSSHEAKVYLAALELGGSTATEIAEKARLPRTTVNTVVNSLHRKGLMSTYLIRRKKVWVAENPEKLLAHLKEHEETLKIILPELRLLQRDTVIRPMIRTYNGAEEIKQIMRNILDTKHHILAILSWDDWTALLGRSFMDDFIESRVRQHLRIRLITPKTKTAFALKKKDASELRETRFLPDAVTINNSNFIYDNKVAIISVRSKQPEGILINDADIHHTMEVLFESLWQQSKEGNGRD